MNRRIALKTIAASFIAPIVRLRSEIDYERLLRGFCEDVSARYDLGAPFSFGSLTYATDSRTMVRADLVNPLECGTKRIPDVEKTWEHFWHPGEFVPFELPAPDSKRLIVAPGRRGYGTCPLCDDRRISFGDKCPDEDTMQRLPEYDVDANDYRDPNCPLCRGHVYTGPSALMIGGTCMSYSRLKPIAALPNVRIAANQMGDWYGPILFTADGFEGMAMGLRQDGDAGRMPVSSAGALTSSLNEVLLERE